MNVIAQIEDAILARLTATLPAAGYKLLIASYAGDLEHDGSEAIRQLPAVWVFFESGGDPKPVGTSRLKWRIPLTYSLIVATRNLRSDRDSRHGGQQGARIEVGSYQLLSDARRTLLNQDLGLPIANLEPGRVRSLSIGRGDRGVSVYAQYIHTAYVETLPAAASDPAAPDWLRAGLHYHLLPDDGKADASDLVTLR